MNSVELTARSGRVKRAARLSARAYRRKTGEFLVEGPQAVTEALAASDCVQEVFATERAIRAHPQLPELVQAHRIDCHVVGDDVITVLADTMHPQGIIARASQIAVGMADLAETGLRLVLVAIDMADPGNAGSLVRVADAAGADAVIMSGDSVDVHNPKAVRASAGSIFHLPIAVHSDTAGILNFLRSCGLQVLATDGAGDVDLFSDSLDLTKPTAWLMGNEAHGLQFGRSYSGQTDNRVRVPIFGRAESLNLASAAAVCAYASARAQRRLSE